MVVRLLRGLDRQDSCGHYGMNCVSRLEWGFAKVVTLALLLWWLCWHYLCSDHAGTTAILLTEVIHYVPHKGNTVKSLTAPECSA